jgi:KipI family sensor histidine kinase inhibitor
VNVLPFGDAALLVELDDLDAVLAFTAAARAADLDGLLDVVPAAQTVLLVTEPGTALAPLVKQVTTLTSTLDVDSAGSDVEAVEIEVVYDGPDLAEVARLTGLDEEEVVAAHTGTPWRIAFGGFAPGFAYLTGGDPRLAVPRRDEPRTSVPAGAVGLAGEYSGVYPRSSPGGWQLIGRTDAILWDASRNPPALLAPGGTVRFRAVPRLDGDRS